MDDEIVLRVKGSSDVTSLASAIAHNVYDRKAISLRAIGAAAVNQSAKAIAVANNLVGARGLTLWMRPGFTDVEMPEGLVTALVLRIKVE